MKKLYILGAVALVAASLSSCNDFLNDNRYPMSIQTANDEYWSSSTNVQSQVNYFYEYFTGYGYGSSTGEFYFKTLSDDQTSAIGATTMAPWKNLNVPTSSSNWNTPYIHIRRANLIIEGVESGTMDDASKNNFIGIARLMRGYMYYQLVRAYGDVPLVTKALDPVDEAELYGARTDRNEVMDYALADLDFAIANISTESSKNAFSKDLARAIKSEVCLFEGSYAKYHQKDATRANKYFQEVVNAATPLLASYPIGSSYSAIYTSFRDAASSNSEIIFMKEYEKDVLMHCTTDYTSSSTPVSGITKDAFDSYLFKDGKPLALTSEDKNDAGVLDANGNLSIANVLAVRDGRLSETIDDVVYYTGAAYQRTDADGNALTMKMTSCTGYGVKKYYNPNMGYNYITTIWNYNCAPLYWGAYVALNYAEAKAELGTITDADLNLTLNKLYARAGLPDQTVASLSSMNDPANDMGVSSLLFEVRRCRRCELIMDKDIRYWDLVRWRQLDRLATANHINITLGANVTNRAADADIANVNGYIDAANGSVREFKEREYLFPIPSAQISLNENLTQNPGWN